MVKAHVIYNPLAGNGQSAQASRQVESLWDGPVTFYDMTHITNYGVFLANLAPEDALIIAGGDGTLNRFANAIGDLSVSQEIYYFPTGTGNDFAHEMHKDALCRPFLISPCLKNLPSVQVQGKSYRFVNGVGFGIDGYCCEEGDRLREKKPGKKVNYTMIAIKGLLLHFKPRNAKVTVDGKESIYKKVWIAPTMFGKYYGGGMKAAPNQDRFSEDGTLSLMMFHGGGRLRTLCAFPGIFKGEHIKHDKIVTILTGKQITVEFDRPTPLQIDGETVSGVTTYTATTCGKI